MQHINCCTPTLHSSDLPDLLQKKKSFTLTAGKNRAILIIQPQSQAMFLGLHHVSTWKNIFNYKQKASTGHAAWVPSDLDGLDKIN